jgi:peptide/nickel transport system permease protein
VAIEAAQAGLSAPAEATPSSWSMFFWRLRRNPKAMIGGAIVALLIFVALFANLLAPADPTIG